MPGTIRKITGRWETPFTARLKHFVDFTADDLAALRGLIDYEATIEKRRDLVIDGYPYTKLSFIKEGMAARYKVLRNGKRQIVDVLIPGDVVGLPSSFHDRASFSVIALTDMKLEVCSFDAFITACYQRPKFALALEIGPVEKLFPELHALVGCPQEPEKTNVRACLRWRWAISRSRNFSGSEFGSPGYPSAITLTGSHSSGTAKRSLAASTLNPPIV